MRALLILLLLLGCAGVGSDTVTAPAPGVFTLELSGPAQVDAPPPLPPA